MMVSQHTPPDTSRLRKDAAANRRRLIDAARLVFTERGVQAPLALVSRRAGLGIGTLYRRFPNREVLLEALFNEERHLYIHVADEALKMPDAWAGFEYYISRICELQADYGTIREFLSFAPNSTSGLIPPQQELFGYAQKLVERAQQQGTLRPDVEVGDTALIVWANAEIIRVTQRVSPDQWRRYVALMLNGLRCKFSRLVPTALGSEIILKAMQQNMT